MPAFQSLLMIAEKQINHSREDPEVGAFYAIEPFNTTGKSGKIEDIQPSTSSNIHRVTGNITVRKAVAKKKLKPLGATMARYIEERYSTLPSPKDGLGLLT